MKLVAPLSLLVALAACARPAQQHAQRVAPTRATSGMSARNQTSGTTARHQTSSTSDLRHEMNPAPSATAVADNPFQRLDQMAWPGPNEFRSADGSPGPAYWQQRADYDIQATLDTTSKTLRGHVAIHYTNNSPDTLRFVWLQVDQNLYRPGSLGSSVNPPDSRWGVRGFQGGYTLSHVTAFGKAVRPDIHDTMMRLDLPRPLAPHGGQTVIAMDYAFPIPEHGSDRMGRDSTLYELAQWYPRLVVYDDVRGWNTDPYLGQGEFYLEYGDITYAVTVPAGYTVAGSGVLQNPTAVLSGAERARLAVAATADTIVPIIRAGEAKAVATPGTKTWRFRAERVRDVAWAAAPDFRWDATSAPVGDHRVLTQAYYQFPKAGKAWETGAEQTQWTITHFSRTFFPFPYPQATSVAGPVGGMEYPMFVMVHYGSDDPKSTFGTINHEHGHEWFPMMVGSNERRYAWMDEGINTYIDAFANEARYPGTSAWAGYLRNWKQAVDNGTQVPLMTPPDRIDRAALGAIGYRKPAAVLLALRDHVVGRETFDKAFRTYIRRWAFKHPTPSDFFRTIEDVSGDDLSWYWRSFFYSTDVLDIGVDSVTTAMAADSQLVADVVLTRHTSIPFPVEMRLALADGTTEDVKLPVDVWYTGSKFAASIPVKARVVGVRLWPDPSVPDWNAANDTWGAAPRGDAVAPVTMGGLASQMGRR